MTRAFAAFVSATALMALVTATPVCHWDVTDPRLLTDERMRALCRALQCPGACPQRCFVVRPPNVLLVPATAAAEASVRAVFGAGVRRVCDDALRKHAALAAMNASGAADASVAEYDIVAAPWMATLEDAVALVQRVAPAPACTRVVLISRELNLLRGTCTAAGAAALAQQPDLMSVRARVRPRVHNEWTAEWFARGEFPASQPTASVAVDWGAHTGPLARWAGLDGTGQVVGHIDTGADLQSAYLRDPAISAPPYVPCGADGDGPAQAAPGVPVSFPDRRRVVQYVWNAYGTGACGADAVDADGHGTHTGATVAGAADCAPAADGCAADVARFDGHAPGARLAVFDAGPDAQGYLEIPNDLGASALAWATAAGAHVHANSWGAQDAGLYGALDYQVDAYAVAHPEALLLVAAGNNGASGTAALSAVASPGLAKNALTVGATVSTTGANAAAFCGSDAAAPNAGLCALLTGGSQSPNDVAYFSAHGVRSSGRRAKPDLAAPGYFVFSAANAQPSGGASGTAASAGGQNAWRAGTVQAMAGTSMATPAVAALAALVRQYFAQGWWPCGWPGSGTPWTRVSGALVKAVLIATAQELSGTQCNDAACATSHAISVAAAGVPNAYQGYGGARAPGGYAAPAGGGSLLRVAAQTPLVAPLSLPALDAGALPDGVAAEHAFTQTGESVAYTVCVWPVYAGAAASTWPARSLRATLVWTDPPVAPMYTADADLMNDLDLAVLDADTSAIVALGNDEIHAADTGAASRTNPAAQPDTTSNVEVAVLRGAAATPGRRLTVQVAATRVLVAPQRFALVLSGGWGVCNASAAQRCEGTAGQVGGGGPTPAPTPAPVVRPFDRVFVPYAPAALYTTLAFDGTSRPCVSAATAVGLCDDAYDRVARVEAVAGFATGAGDGALVPAPALTLVRARAVDNPAATLFAPDDPLAWPPAGARVSWALRVTLPTAADGAGWPLYVSLPAAETGAGMVSTAQRLVVRAVPPPAPDANATVDPWAAQAAAAALGWLPASDGALRSADADRAGAALTSTALRVVGTSARLPEALARAVDTVWALQVLPDTGDSAVLCAHALRGCTCTFETVHGFEGAPYYWRPAAAIAAALLVAGVLVHANAQRSAAPADGKSRGGIAYSRIDTGGVASQPQPPTPPPRDPVLPVHVALLLVTSVRAEAPATRTLAWSAAGALACAFAAWPALGIGYEGARAWLVRAGVAMVATAAALGTDLLATPVDTAVYADVYTLVAVMVAAATVGETAQLTARLDAAARATALTLATTVAWACVCMALTARTTWQTQASVGSVAIACVAVAHAHPAFPAASTWLLVCAALASSALVVRTPCE